MIIGALLDKLNILKTDILLDIATFFGLVVMPAMFSLIAFTYILRALKKAEIQDAEIDYSPQVQGKMTTNGELEFLGDIDVLEMENEDLNNSSDEYDPLSPEARAEAARKQREFENAEVHLGYGTMTQAEFDMAVEEQRKEKEMYISNQPVTPYYDPDAAALEPDYEELDPGHNWFPPEYADENGNFSIEVMLENDRKMEQEFNDFTYANPQKNDSFYDDEARYYSELEKENELFDRI